ncbi:MULTISPECIES: hypothetical protein [unclassified Streptomyces]|uniref:hypothetical protein n=1 Tax=unclassified Streptomyces TaxID=2593676 RepID=UPI00166213C3|nr:MULTISPECIES: hypothetical protein [unclassified Streptomyces]MBD0842523.1 hypothetical protein [Streptomyces sp. TRM68416]
MTTQARKQKAASSAERHFHNAQGAEVKTHDEAFALQQQISPEAVSAAAKLVLHNGSVTFDMEVKYNPNTYPHVITGGQITGTICGAPWNITGGFIGQTIRLDAKRAGTGSCAETLTVVGEYQNPPAYRGTYGFNGAASSFRHTTVYHC